MQNLCLTQKKYLLFVKFFHLKQPVVSFINEPGMV